MKLPKCLGLLLTSTFDYGTVVATASPKATAEWFVKRLNGRIRYGDRPADVPSQFIWILDPKEDVPPVKLAYCALDYGVPTGAIHGFGHLALAVRSEFSLRKFVDALVAREGFVIVDDSGNGVWFILQAPAIIGSFYVHLVSDRSDTMKDPHLRSEDEPDTIFFERDPNYEQDRLCLAQFQKEEVPLPAEDSSPIEPVVGPEVPLESGEDEEGTGD